MKTKPRPLLAIYDADGKSTVRLLATARRQLIAAARVGADSRSRALPPTDR